MRLYIIRHAQSENNARWASTGTSDGRSSDPLLTETGRQQARQLATFLARAEPEAQTDPWDVTDQRGFGITHLYTSLMQRAVLTGTDVAQALDLPLVAWPDIHESAGIFEYDVDGESRIGLPGPNRSFYEAHYPNLVLPDSLGEEGWWNRPSETRVETRLRARRVAAELFDRHGQTEDHVAFITHGAFTEYFLSELLDRRPPESDDPDPRRLWLMMSNTGITRLQYTDRYATLFYTNRLEHLPPHLITA